MLEVLRHTRNVPAFQVVLAGVLCILEKRSLHAVGKVLAAAEGLGQKVARLE